MGLTEILHELSALSSEDLNCVRDRLDELQSGEIVETPEMLAAIDEGLRSADSEPCYTIEQIRAEIPTWFTKSS